MTLPTWPSTAGFPQAGQIENMSGGPQSSVVSFQPQQGPTIDRRKSSSVTRKRKITLPPMSLANYTIFVTFFETTLAFGTLPFTWTDPFKAITNQRMKFVQNDPVYNEVMVTPTLVQIDFEVQMY